MVLRFQWPNSSVTLFGGEDAAWGLPHTQAEALTELCLAQPPRQLPLPRNTLKHEACRTLLVEDASEGRRCLLLASTRVVCSAVKHGC